MCTSVAQRTYTRTRFKFVKGCVTFLDLGKSILAKRLHPALHGPIKWAIQSLFAA